MENKKEIAVLWKRYKELTYKRNRLMNKVGTQNGYVINEIEEEMFEIENELDRRLKG